MVRRPIEELRSRVAERAPVSFIWMLVLSIVQSNLPETEGAPPVVLGEMRSATAKTTVTFYAHYDGQPVDARAWSSRLRPLKRELSPDE
jgi:hypothetical protein